MRDKVCIMPEYTRARAHTHTHTHTHTHEKVWHDRLLVSLHWVTSPLRNSGFRWPISNCDYDHVTLSRCSAFIHINVTESTVTVNTIECSWVMLSQYSHGTPKIRYRYAYARMNILGPNLNLAHKHFRELWNCSVQTLALRVYSKFDHQYPSLGTWNEPQLLILCHGWNEDWSGEVLANST